MWFFRHGERQDFVDPSWSSGQQHPYDTPLSVIGHQQAQEVATYMSDIPIDHLFCSPFTRAVQTGSPTAKTLGMPLKIEHGFCEIFYASWFPTPPTLAGLEEAGLDESLFDASYESAVMPVYPETDATVLERAGKVLAHILNNYSGNIAIFAHGGICYPFTESIFGEKQDITMPYCSLIRADWIDGNWVLQKSGHDLSHLSEKPRG
ncbi:MAG: histidine phosphatase family protein [Lentisphaeria bacterium]|nr:histidine phosphatase family protein [Lentisphaeria bacterium]